MALKARQLAYIDFLMANPMMTNTEAAKACGVNRNTLTEWKKLPEFQEEYKRRLREQWEGAEMMAQETMRKLAKSGDFKAAKYILDSLNYAPATKIEADINQEISISIGE
jgi:hypothetical protein